MKEIEESRKRKAQDLAEKLRNSRNKEAETIQTQLEHGIEGVNNALRTLDEEIALREADIQQGETSWRRNEIRKAMSLADEGYKAAKILQKLCHTIKIGLGTLATLTDIGFAYVDNEAYEGSATLMAVCRGSPVTTTRDLKLAVEEMREVNLLGLRMEDDVEDENLKGRRIKRKRG